MKENRVTNEPSKHNDAFAGHESDSLIIRKMFGCDIQDFVYQANDAIPSMPRRRYVILFTPRSGSTVLSEYIAATGVLGYPLEFYVEWIARSINAARADDQEDMLSFISRVFQSKGGIFGIEIEWGRLQNVLASFNGFKDSDIFYLTRRDKLLQAISLRRAVRTGAWHSLATGKIPLAYDREDIIRHIDFIMEQETRFEELFRDFRITPNRLFYEDIEADIPAAVRAIARSMSVREKINLEGFGSGILSSRMRNSLSHEEAWLVMSSGGSYYGYDIRETKAGFVATLAGLASGPEGALPAPLMFEADTRSAIEARVWRAVAGRLQRDPAIESETPPST